MVEYVDVRKIDYMEIKTIFDASMFDEAWSVPYRQITNDIADGLRPHFGELEVKRQTNPVLKQKVGGKMLNFAPRSNNAWDYIIAKTHKKVLGVIPVTEEETVFALDERIFEDVDKKSGIVVYINVGDNAEAERVVMSYLDRFFEGQKQNIDRVDRVYLRKGFA